MILRCVTKMTVLHKQIYLVQKNQKRSINEGFESPTNVIKSNRIICIWKFMLWQRHTNRHGRTGYGGENLFVPFTFKILHITVFIRRFTETKVKVPAIHRVGMVVVQFDCINRICKTLNFVCHIFWNILIAQINFYY
jgi:hypothetical protein